MGGLRGDRNGWDQVSRIFKEPLDEHGNRFPAGHSDGIQEPNLDQEAPSQKLKDQLGIKFDDDAVNPAHTD